VRTIPVMRLVPNAGFSALLIDGISATKNRNWPILMTQSCHINVSKL